MTNINTTLKDGFQCLNDIYTLTEELGDMLQSGELDGILEKLRQREDLTNHLAMNENCLKSIKEIANHQSNDRNSILEMKEMIKSILDMDKKNVEFIKLQMKETADSLADLTKGKKAIQNLHSISTKGQKQIVNLVQ